MRKLGFCADLISLLSNISIESIFIGTLCCQFIVLLYVIQIGNSEFDPSDLTPFFDKVHACNRNVVSIMFIFHFFLKTHLFVCDEIDDIAFNLISFRT